MSRTLMLTDVTQMAADAVCVAGIDLATDETIRLANPQPTQPLITALGNLSPGDILRLDARPLRKLEPPHVEDCEWNPRSVKRVGVAPLAEMMTALESTAFTSVQAAFGEPVTRGRYGNSSWTPAVGSRSLATISVVYVRAAADKNERPRIAFKDDSLDYWQAVPMQDLRAKMHHANCPECTDGQYVERLQAEFDANRTLIRVGLTRPFSPGEGTEPMCWLQVTNILSKPREHFDTLLLRAPKPQAVAVPA